MRYPIQTPIPIVQQWSVAFVEYSVKEFVPSSHITFMICYLDADGNYLNHPGLLYETTIEGEEYTNWGTEDGYIMNVLELRVQAALLTLSP